MYGEVDHSLFFDAEDGRWWGGETQIRRSIFMGDFVVALSAGGVTATNLSTLNQSASVELDRQWPEYYYDDRLAVYDDVEEEEAKSDDSEGKDDDREAKGDDGKSTSDGSDRPDDDDAGAAPDSDRQ